jgi:hypothetical protein
MSLVILQILQDKRKMQCVFLQFNIRLCNQNNNSMINEILSKIFDVIVNKVAFPIAILCGLLLFLPQNILAKMEVLPIVNIYRGIIWILFLFSSLIYLYDKGKTFVNFIKKAIERKIKKSKRNKQIISNLIGLSPQEKAWIYYCLLSDKRTLIAQTINETAVSLENKGIVYRPSGSYSVLETPFTIGPSTWEYLCANKEIFCPQEKIDDKSYNQEVYEFIRDLRSVI